MGKSRADVGICVCVCVYRGRVMVSEGVKFLGILTHSVLCFQY